MRSQGRATHVLYKREAVPGTAPAGNYVRLPFNKNTLGLRRGNVTGTRAGAGRGQKDIYQDLPVVDGDHEMPLCMRNVGYLLTLLMGNPVTTEDDGVFTHVFSSQTAALPTGAMEIGHSNIPVFNMNTRVLVNTMALGFQRQGGPATINFGLIGQKETSAGVTGGGVPTEHGLIVASKFKGNVKLGGVDIANLQSADLNYSNNYDVLDFVNTEDGEMSGADPDDPTVTGQLSLRFATMDHYNAAKAKTPVDLALSYVAAPDFSLSYALHEVYLEKTVPPIEGPGGVVAQMNYEGIFNSEEGAVATATLINDLPGNSYTG